MERSAPFLSGWGMNGGCGFKKWRRRILSVQSELPEVSNSRASSSLERACIDACGRLTHEKCN